MTLHKKIMSLAGAVCLALPLTAHAQDNREAAAASLASGYDNIVKELITITEIPAPPFKEEVRGDWMMQRFRSGRRKPR